MAIFSGDVFEGNVFDWSAFEIEIFETHERVVCIESNQIVIRLTFGDSGDVSHASVSAVASEMKSILVEGDSIALETNIAEIKVIDMAHPDVVGHGICDGNIAQRKTIDPKEIEDGAAPCVWVEQIFGFCVARALVVSVPDTAPDPDFLIAIFVIGVCQEKIASFFRSVSA